MVPRYRGAPGLATDRAQDYICKFDTSVIMDSLDALDALDTMVRPVLRTMRDIVQHADFKFVKILAQGDENVLQLIVKLCTEEEDLLRWPAIPAGFQDWLDPSRSDDVDDDVPITDADLLHLKRRYNEIMTFSAQVYGVMDLLLVTTPLNNPDNETMNSSVRLLVYATDNLRKDRVKLHDQMEAALPWLDVWLYTSPFPRALMM